MENTVKPEELKYLLENNDDVLILDVRRRQDYENDPDIILCLIHQYKQYYFLSRSLF
jgi:hypothetical protein